MAAESAKPPKTARRAAAEPRAQLVVKMGGSEVRFEAGLAAVEERFDRLMERLLAGQPAARGTASVAGTSPAVAMRRLAAEPRRAAAAPAVGGNSPAHGNYPSFSLDLEQVAELFSVNAANELSLRVMPRGLKQREVMADALVLLLYGKLVLQGTSPVTAPALLRSARQSGLDLDRASRLLAHRRTYVATEGRKRGKRYRLTDAGVRFCEELIAKLGAGGA